VFPSDYLRQDPIADDNEPRQRQRSAKCKQKSKVAATRAL